MESTPVAQLAKEEVQKVQTRHTISVRTQTGVLDVLPHPIAGTCGAMQVGHFGSPDTVTPRGTKRHICRCGMRRDIV